MKNMYLQYFLFELKLFAFLYNYLCFLLQIRKNWMNFKGNFPKEKLAYLYKHMNLL